MAQTLTEFDTIAAISTPIGEGGISIVRMSGEDAIKIADEVFKRRRSKQGADTYYSLWSYYRSGYWEND